MTYILRLSAIVFHVDFNSTKHITSVTNITHLTSVYTNRGSYMSDRVLLNLLNELGKGDKIRGLSSIFFSHFFATSL